jgi:O-antigen/teichoic acid export membrane protein
VLWFSNWYYLFFAFIILYQERLILARAKLEILKYNFLNIIQKIIFLLFLYYMHDDLTAGIALFFLGISYLLSYLIILIWKEDTSFNIPIENEINKTVFLKFCTVTMFTMIVHWMLTVSDQVIIKYYYGYVSLAPYAVAYRIVTMLGLVSGIFLSYYPSVYFKELTAKNMVEVFVLRKYFVFILMMVTLGILFFKDTVYVILGAAGYISESEYFLPLLLGEMCRTIASVLMTFLTFKLQQAHILLSMLFIAILNIVLNILFVPYWGPIAAAYCTLMCFILYLGVSFFISYIPERRYIMAEVIS